MTANPLTTRICAASGKVQPLMSAEALQRDFMRQLGLTLGRDQWSVNAHYRYTALALALRDRLMSRWMATHKAYYETGCRRAYYLSMEWLMGRALRNAVLNLGLEKELEAALKEHGLELSTLAEEEPDAGLGNGGLGRLAACFLDSCATLQLPVIGYGLRYEYGMFRQRISNGAQLEEPDHWLVHGYPWELERPEYTQVIHFGGHTETYLDAASHFRVRWVDTQDVQAVPYDLPVPGYRNDTVNTLRLWRARAKAGFDLAEFNRGDYIAAVNARNEAENISMVLYPNDRSENGKELRLKQQYFLASASMQDVIRRWVRIHGPNFTQFADFNCFQLNDTHPTIAIPELLRILLDQHGLGWDAAWDLVSRTMAYTNHTLLPEALEKWPVAMLRRLLPRILEIIFEINSRFLRKVANHWPGENGHLSRMSLIEDGPEPQVRMAYLAIVASFSVNGVAELHSRLLQSGLFSDFHEFWPSKFNNKTNGVTQRRWLAGCNPGLRGLITETLGDEAWITDLSRLTGLEKHLRNAAFRKRWQEVRRSNKARLAALVEQECGIILPLEALFDVQVKRIHEYKRQLLNLLHAIHLYDRIKRGQAEGQPKRVVIIGGKAAPGYTMAKLIIRLANAVAEVVNQDEQVGDRLKVVFLPDYRVTAMEIICPGTDLSEQISTAGKEASGTGNMKFMMNGAVTIGTLDGANIEIREEVGDDNFLLFGLTAAQVEDLRPHYDPQPLIAADEDLQRVIHLLRSHHFNPHEPGLFDDILHYLTEWRDYWMVVADFRSYVEAQQKAAAAFLDEERWTRMSILNTARSGKFSTDRTMMEYNRDIWHLQPVKPQLD